MLIKRNMLVYFRDRSTVIFSLYAVFIMIGLYILFLGRIMEQALQSILAGAGAAANIPSGPVMTSVVLAGIVASTAVTSGMFGIYRFVADKESAAKDFFTTQISKRKIVFSYVVGAALIGLIMASAALAISLIYLAINGNNVINLQNLGRLAVTAILTALCANSMVYLISVVAKTREAFMGLTNILTTLIGFLMGVFIPIGNLPDTVAWVLRLFPLSHGASMFRQIFADEVLYELFAYVNAPPQYLEEFRLFFGVVFRFGDYTTSFWFSAAVLAVATVFFYGMSLVVMRGKLPTSY